MAKKSHLIEEVQKPQIYPIKVVKEKHIHVTRHAERDERWDRDDTSSDWDVLGIQLVPEEGVGDLYVNFPIEINKTYWLVYAVYNTGDSFGRDENGALEEIEIYKDETMALDCAREIRKHADMYSVYERTYYRPKMKRPKDFDSYILVVIGNDGKELEVHAPWNGYFESLSYVEVRPVTIINGSRRF